MIHLFLSDLKTRLWKWKLLSRCIEERPIYFQTNLELVNKIKNIVDYMNRVSQILCLISNHSLACKILNKILAMEYFDSNGHLNPASRGIII